MSTPKYGRPEDEPTQFLPPQPAPPRPQTLAYSQQPFEHEPTADVLDARNSGWDIPTPPIEERTNTPKRRVDLAVDLPKYLGSAVVTTVIAALVGYLGVLLLNVVTTWVPESYWTRHGLGRPENSAITAAALAGASAVIAAGVMWLLLTITARTGMFFTVITVLVGAIGFLTTLASGPWQSTVGVAILFAVTAGVIGGLTCGYARLCTTRPDRY